MNRTKIRVGMLALLAYSLFLTTSLFAQWELSPPDAGNCTIDNQLGTCANEGERCMDSEYQCLHCTSITMPFGVPGCTCN